MWFEALTLNLREIGFYHHTHDQCIMTKKTKRGTIVLAIYVDDILVVYDRIEDADWLIKKLEQEYETIEVEKGK